MRLSALTKMIVPLYETQTPITLVGAPGIGKSDTVHELPAILSEHYGEAFGHVTVEASTLDAPDVIGFLIPTKGENGEALARYTKPDIVRQIERTKCERGILFIDEIGQADSLVQKSLAPLFIGNKLGEYFVPEGWYIVAATNRIEDKAGVNKELSHFTNRQCRLEIESNIEDWVVWARNNGVHHMAMAFAGFRPGVVMSDVVPAKPGPYCTPRSFTKAAAFLNNLLDDEEDEIPANNTVQAIVSGYIGAAASAEFFAFLKTREFLPTWDEILQDPKKAKAPPNERLDAAYAAAGLITSKADNKTVDVAFTYATRLPIELQTSICRTLVQTMGGSALNAPSINKFVSQHKALILNSID